MASSLSAIYEQDGVVPLGQIFTPDEVAEALTRLERLFSEHDVENQAQDGGAFYRFDSPSKYDAWFAGLLTHERILARIGEVFGPDFRIFQDQIFMKPAHIGSRTHYHQDNIYWNVNPPVAATLWVALDPATPENGALSYMANSRHELLVPAGPNQNVDGQIRPGPITPEQLASFDERIWTVPAGHGVLHHCQTIHGASPNRTPNPRRGYTVHLRQV